MSLAKRGKPSARRGFHLSEEQKEKISNANKGRKLSEHTKEKMSKSRKGKKQQDQILFVNMMKIIILLKYMILYKKRQINSI